VNVHTAGRWLPDGVHVERADDGRVRLRGGEYDGRTFDSMTDLLRFVRETYPHLHPKSR
jgi:hypothetical protein